MTKLTNDNGDSRNSGGVSSFTVVLIVFIILKLVGVIDWSWWWVMSPLWISLILGVVILIVSTICCYIKLLREDRYERKVSKTLKELEELKTRNTRVEKDNDTLD